MKKALIQKVSSIADLIHKATTDPLYKELAMIAATNLGGSPKDLREARHWLSLNATESPEGEAGVVEEINGCRNIIKVAKAEAAQAKPPAAKPPHKAVKDKAAQKPKGESDKAAVKPEAKPTGKPQAAPGSSPAKPEAKGEGKDKPKAEHRSSKGIAAFIRACAQDGVKDEDIVTRCREKDFECSINTVKKALGKPTVKTYAIFSKDVLPQPEAKPGEAKKPEAKAPLPKAPPAKKGGAK